MLCELFNAQRKEIEAFGDCSRYLLRSLIQPTVRYSPVSRSSALLMCVCSAYAYLLGPNWPCYRLATLLHLCAAEIKSSIYVSGSETQFRILGFFPCINCTHSNISRCLGVYISYLYFYWALLRRHVSINSSWMICERQRTELPILVGEGVMPVHNGKTFLWKSLCQGLEMLV